MNQLINKNSFKIQIKIKLIKIIKTKINLKTINPKIKRKTIRMKMILLYRIYKITILMINK